MRLYRSQSVEGLFECTRNEYKHKQKKMSSRDTTMMMMKLSQPKTPEQIRKKQEPRGWRLRNDGRVWARFSFVGRTHQHYIVGSVVSIPRRSYVVRFTTVQLRETHSSHSWIQREKANGVHS